MTDIVEFLVKGQTVDEESYPLNHAIPDSSCFPSLFSLARYNRVASLDDVPSYCDSPR